MIMEEESIEKKDFFTSFLREVERDLKKNRTSYVFSEEQLSWLRKKYDIKIVSREEGIIYIELIKE